MAVFSKSKKGKADQGNRISAMIVELVRAVCNDEGEVYLFWHELNHTSKGIMAEISDETMAIANPNNIKPSLLDPSLPITVLFSHLGRIFTFTTWFVLYTKGGTDPDTGEQMPPWLVLQLPQRIAATDSRTAAKIKITPQTPFRIECVMSENETLPAQAQEITLTGINLSIDPDPSFKVDNKVILKMGIEEEIEIEGEAVLGEGEEKAETTTKKLWKPLKIEAVVRGRDGNKYNFYFPVSLTPEGIKPPPPLRELVHEVERQYLRQRAESEME